MKNHTQSSFRIVIGVAFLLALQLPALEAKGKLGKLFVKAQSQDGQQFVDPRVQDTVKDIREGAGQFELVSDESDADFLLIVVGRDDTPMAGQPTAKRVSVTLSVRDGAEWKPGIKISKVSPAWGTAARHVVGDVEKWVKQNAGKK
jgi:hypothetical protein